MKPLSMSVLLAGLMTFASVAGIAARPEHKVTVVDPLETMVPTTFGEWSEVRQQTAQVVNPQTQQLLDKLYSQTLQRTYVDANGYRIMLSLAYGDDQRGGLTAHRPEVCYPAQGFALKGMTDVLLQTPFGPIAARRLNTSMGSRLEPVTYWFNVGDTPIRNQLEQRWVELRLGVLGQVPDGLLFRVSSIDDQSERAYTKQQQFVSDLLKSVDEKTRTRLAGFQSPKSKTL